jgi:hypothetical protein
MKRITHMNVLGVMTGMAKGAAGLTLSAVVLWQVAEHSVPDMSELVVHVCELGVDVTVDDLGFRVDDYRDMPVVCSVRAGKHLLRMYREGKVIYEEGFTVRRGEDRVLAAWDETRYHEAREEAGGPPPGIPDPTARHHALRARAWNPMASFTPPPPEG